MRSTAYGGRVARGDELELAAPARQANRKPDSAFAPLVYVGQDSSKTNFQLMADRSPRGVQLAAWSDVMNVHAGRNGRFAVHSPAQLKKKKKGIWCAESESEARTLMSDYAGRIGLTWSELDDPLKQLCIDFAQDPEKDGINGGEMLIFGEKREIEEKRRKAERAKKVKKDYATIEGQFTDDLAKSAFGVARATYVGGASVNAGLSGVHSEDDYYAAKMEWDDIGDTTTVTNFHSFDPEDKAAIGKGNVGATLATRKVQGNLLCSFDGTKINVHVDIAE